MALDFFRHHDLHCIVKEHKERLHYERGAIWKSEANMFSGSQEKCRRAALQHVHKAKATIINTAIYSARTLYTLRR